MKLNGLVKRIIGAVAGLFGLCFALIGKNIKMIVKATVGGVTHKASGKMKFFDFLSDAKDAKLFDANRVLFWIAFVLVIIALVWFIFAIVAEVVGNKKLAKIANKYSKYVSIVLVVAVVLVTVAGIIPETEKALGYKQTNTPSVFSSFWYYLLAVTAIGSTAVEFAA